MSLPIFDASSSGNLTSPGTNFTFSHTCTGGDLYLIVFLYIPNTHSGATVTYNSVSMTNLGSCTNASNSRQLYAFGLANPSTGSNTVSCSWTTSRTSGAVSVSYKNVSQFSPIGTLVSNTGTTGNTSINLAIDNNSIGVDCTALYRAANTTAPTATQGGSQTLEKTMSYIISATDSARIASSDMIGSGTITMSWTQTNQTEFNQLGLPLRGSPNFFPLL